MSESALVRPRTDLSDDRVNKICDVIRETGFAMHKYFGPGYREKVYERSLAHRLSKSGLVVQVQPRDDIRRRWYGTDRRSFGRGRRKCCYRRS